MGPNQPQQLPPQLNLIKESWDRYLTQVLPHTFQPQENEGAFFAGAGTVLMNLQAIQTNGLTQEQASALYQGMMDELERYANTHRGPQ